MKLTTRFIDENIAYSGKELSAHWVSARTGIFGPGIVAFRGRCKVETEELVDLEDRRQKSRIEALEMLHFLGEWFDGDLSLAVARQRLFIAGFAELLMRRIELPLGTTIERTGNDLYVIDSGANSRWKLSVSIVTASPVSTLFHFGVNIDASGAPVSAIGLADLRVDPTLLAKDVLAAWELEWESMLKARCKVMPR